MSKRQRAKIKYLLTEQGEEKHKKSVAKYQASDKYKDKKRQYYQNKIKPLIKQMKILINNDDLITDLINQLETSEMTREIHNLTITVLLSFFKIKVPDLRKIEMLSSTTTRIDNIPIDDKTYYNLDAHCFIINRKGRQLVYSINNEKIKHLITLFIDVKDPEQYITLFKRPLPLFTNWSYDDFDLRTIKPFYIIPKKYILQLK